MAKTTKKSDSSADKAAPAKVKKKTSKKKASAKKSPVKQAAAKKTTVKKKTTAKKKATAKKTGKKVGAGKTGRAKPGTASARPRRITSQERHHLVAEAAYLRSEAKGFSGDAHADWLAAEAEVDARLKKAKIMVSD